MPLIRDRTSSRIPWLQLGLEAFFVLLGVLLALALDEWRQGRREQKVVALALQNIRNEIKENRAEVQRAIDWHRDLLSRLEKTPDMNISFKPAILRNNAWQAAQSSQAAANMQFSSVAAFSRMEDMQDLYQGFVTNVTPLFYSNGPGPPTMILYDFVYFEELLLQVYDEAERVIPKD
jgi:hypothetical protein